MSNDKNEFPLFPQLNEKGNEEAIKLIESFKKEISKAADEVISDLYCEIMPHIESDSWSNYRNDLMNGLQDYNHRKLQAPHDFKKIRQQIYKDFREDIIPDLNRDMVKEIEELKADIERMKKWEIERNRF